MNATLLMLLVDHGLVDLDAARGRAIFRASDRAIFPRRTLATGDALQSYVEVRRKSASGLSDTIGKYLRSTFERTIAETAIHAPGAARSYCNCAARSWQDISATASPAPAGII